MRYDFLLRYNTPLFTYLLKPAMCIAISRAMYF